MALLDRVLPAPARTDRAGLWRGVRSGSERHAATCLRWLGVIGVAADVAPLLERARDPAAAIRRGAFAALAGIGAREPGASIGDSLRAACLSDPTDEGFVAAASARAAHGESHDAILADARDRDSQRLAVPGGARDARAAAGAPPVVERVEIALGAQRGGAAAAHRAALAARAGDRAAVALPRRALAELGSLRDPRDALALAALLPLAGRREEHVVLEALGLCGEPAHARALEAALRSTDVDPGRGFQHRRLAAMGLGRVGLRSSGAALVAAAEVERRDYEGRPGAGLGIQFPVRAAIAWALGEIGDASGTRPLVAMLGDTHGTALGGLQLPAMDALRKIGARAAPALERASRGSDPGAAANARVVLAEIARGP